MTNDELDDLVEEWHDAIPGDRAFGILMDEFICEITGWTQAQYYHWVMTGRLP